MIRLVRVAILIAGLFVAAAPRVGQAHHSFAMFDYAKTVTLNGEIKDFQWINPHVVATVYATTGAGPPEPWSIEMTSPGNLTRAGWTRKALKPGDKVALDMHPLRDGQHGGAFVQVKLLDSGQILRAASVGASSPP